MVSKRSKGSPIVWLVFPGNCTKLWVTLTAERQVASALVQSVEIQFGLGLFPRDQRLHTVFGDGSMQIAEVFSADQRSNIGHFIYRRGI